MDFGFSDEQELLRAEVRKFLDQNAPLPRVREIAAQPEGCERGLWSRMAELGWVGLMVPETYGGTGLDCVTAIVLLEETGRSLFPSPLLSTLLAARAIERAGSEQQKARWLPGLAEGTQVASFAYLEASDRHDAGGIRLEGRRNGEVTSLSGSKELVFDTAAADLFVVLRHAEAPRFSALGCARCVVWTWHEGSRYQSSRTTNSNKI